MAGGATVTFLSFTLAHVILRLRVAREWISKRDGYIYTYIQTISEMRRRISCLAPRHSAIMRITRSSEDPEQSSACAYKRGVAGPNEMQQMAADSKTEKKTGT